jgi:hypothetical protein
MYNLRNQYAIRHKITKEIHSCYRLKLAAINSRNKLDLTIRDEYEVIYLPGEE